MAWNLGKKPNPPGGTEQQKADVSPVKGFFRGNEQLISGWAIDSRNLESRRDVDVFVDGTRVGSARADRFDPLVQSHHGGDGHFAFAFYHAGELESGSAEASATDIATKTSLKSKQPMVTRATREGPPLEITGLAVGKAIQLRGRVGAYPWLKDMSLELWRGDTRVMSSIPLIPVNEGEGTFTAQLKGEAVERLLNEDLLVALPGLKEAGLAVAMQKLTLRAAVARHDNGLRVSLRGKFDQTGTIPAVVRFKNEGFKTVEREVEMNGRVGIVSLPPEYVDGQTEVEVVIAGTPVRTRMESPVLGDPKFRTLGQEGARWAATEGATVEQGFFAFPDQLAEMHELSGYTAHLSVPAGAQPLCLWQSAAEVPANKDDVTVGAFVRASRKSKIVLRLRDDEGVLCETSATAKTSDSWTLLQLCLKDTREIVGQPVFEFEASGNKVSNLEVALTHSAEPDAAASEEPEANLLANPGMLDWPHGAGVLQNFGGAVACTGWRVRNRRSRAPTYTRAVIQPATGSIGLAVAAGEVPSYLRIEADFALNDIDDQVLELRFGAGSPPAARQMLARAKEPTPQFAVIDRVYVIRRSRILSADAYSEQDEVVTTFARKVPIRQDVEQYTYLAAPIEEGEEPELENGQSLEVTYHLAFDFRHPTAVALFDVEVVSKSEPQGEDEKSPLKVEDRNIEVQIETLETTAHWRGPTPVRLATEEESSKPRPLKWAANASLEPVTIVIPVFNALDETLACLESINGASTVPVLIRVIDDASDQTVREALHAYAQGKPWISVHSFPQNRGYTYAADFGIRGARTEWAVLLNSDTIVTRGWLEGMLDCARSDPRIGLVGPLSNAASYQSVPELYDAANKWKVNRLPPGVTVEMVADIVRRVSLRAHPHVPLLNGFCTMMKTSVFNDIGGLNPVAFPVGYGEENDMCLRASKAGIRLAVADDVYVYHVKSASFGNARREGLTKAGNEALKKLHPDVDIRALTAKFRDTPALVYIRDRVAAEMSQLHAPHSPEAAKEAAASRPAAKLAKFAKPQLQKA